MTPLPSGPNLAPMYVLKKLSDPVALQVLCDALSERRIPFRVDHAAIYALLPLPGLMDVHVVVEDDDVDAAKRILDDLGMAT